MQRRRDWFLICASTLLIAVVVVVSIQSSEWIGRPFPGFLVLENRVVASAGLARWPATGGGTIYQHEVARMDGAPVTSAKQLQRRVERLPIGTSIEYRLRRGATEIIRRIETRAFDTLDYTLLFGSLLLNGLALALTALMIRYLRGRDVVAAGGFATLFTTGLWSVTAVDLYGPYTLFRMHAACETFLFAGVLHWTLVFPQPLRLIRNRPKVIWCLYGAAAALTAANQYGLYDPAIYRTTHHFAVLSFGASLVFMIGGLFYHYFRPPSFEARQRIKVVALGGAAALFGPLLISLGAAVTGGEIPQNAMTLTGIFFPISVGYAVVRHNLLEVDIFVRRTLNYSVLSVVATVMYVGLIHAGDYVVGPAGGAAEGPIRIILPVVLVLSLLPLRDRLQAGIDRIFFRSSYDFRRTIEQTSARLASFVDLQLIASELSTAIGSTLHPEGLSLYVRGPSGGQFRAIEPHESGPAIGPQDFADLARSRLVLELAAGALAIPCLIGGDLVAVIAIGRPSSGRMYGGDDRRLLLTLANQGAVAIENALALEQLRDLNRDLEAKVTERTEELREAHTQLVHREKMASLGQFVAGIAHELNNPLNFVQGNLFCLQEYLDVTRRTLEEYERTAAQSAPEIGARFRAIREKHDLDGVLDDIDAAFAGCAEGVERSTTLVADLSTFSRRDHSLLVLASVEGMLDSALNLLRGKLAGIDVVRHYGFGSETMCLSGQLDQVFVNLIANACDAMGDTGTLTLTTEQSLGGAGVVITVRDDGAGISPENRGKIFDPFFTTKDVGKGTGLGLSISYGIVKRHDGEIAVESTLGDGTAFIVELPTAGPGPSEEAA